MQGELLYSENTNYDVDMKGNYFQDCSSSLVKLVEPQFQEFGLKENPPLEFTKEFVSKAQNNQVSILKTLIDSKLFKWLIDRMKVPVNTWSEDIAKKFLKCCIVFITGFSPLND